MERWLINSRQHDVRKPFSPRRFCIRQAYPGPPGLPNLPMTRIITAFPGQSISFFATQPLFHQRVTAPKRIWQSLFFRRLTRIPIHASPPKLHTKGVQVSTGGASSVGHRCRLRWELRARHANLNDQLILGTSMLPRQVLAAPAPHVSPPLDDQPCRPSAPTWGVSACHLPDR